MLRWFPNIIIHDLCKILQTYRLDVYVDFQWSIANIQTKI